MPRWTIMVFHGRISHTVAGDSGPCAGWAAEEGKDDFMRFGNNQNEAAGPSVWGDFKTTRFRRLSQSAKDPTPDAVIIRFTRSPLHEYDALLPGRATRAARRKPANACAQPVRATARPAGLLNRRTEKKSHLRN